MNTTIIKTNNEVLTDYPLVLGSYIVKCKNNSLIPEFTLSSGKSIEVLSGDAYIINSSGDLVKKLTTSLSTKLKVLFKKDSIIRVIDNYVNANVLVFREDILVAGRYGILYYTPAADMLEDTSLSFFKGKILNEFWFLSYPYAFDIENTIFINNGWLPKNAFGSLDNFLNKVAEEKKSGVLSITISEATLTYNNTLLTLNGKKKFLFTNNGWTEITT